MASVPSFIGSRKEILSRGERLRWKKRMGVSSFRRGKNDKSPADAELCFDQLFIIYEDYPIRSKPYPKALINI